MDTRVGVRTKRDGVSCSMLCRIGLKVQPWSICSGLNRKKQQMRKIKMDVACKWLHDDGVGLRLEKSSSTRTHSPGWTRAQQQVRYVVVTEE